MIREQEKESIGEEKGESWGDGVWIAEGGVYGIGEGNGEETGEETGEEGIIIVGGLKVDFEVVIVVVVVVVFLFMVDCFVNENVFIFIFFLLECVIVLAVL